MCLTQLGSCWGKLQATTSMGSSLDVSGTTVGPVDETEKQLYQRAVAKLDSLANDRSDLRCATSCLTSAASAPSLGDLQDRPSTRLGRTTSIRYQLST